jgi:hypothetical protein
MTNNNLLRKKAIVTGVGRFRQNEKEVGDYGKLSELGFLLAGFRKSKTDRKLVSKRNTKTEDLSANEESAGFKA